MFSVSERPWLRPTPSYEGYLSLNEAGPSSSSVDAMNLNGHCEWTQRWCALTNGALQVYEDRTAAMTRPERFIRAVPLSTFQKLKASADYDANGKGQWELTLLGESSQSFNVPPKTRGLPRSSTGGSLANAFERDSPISRRPVVSTLRLRQSSENVKDKNGNYSSNTWHNKFASKSKRLYQLMSGNGSSQSLSEQYKQSSNDGSDVGVNLSSISNSSSGTLRAVNSNQGLARTANYQINGTLILRASDAQSMTQWAEALSHCLYDFPPRSSPSPAMSMASMNSMTPSHARKRRPQLASVTDDFNAMYGLASTSQPSSSLVSAAMASQRKRKDSSMTSVHMQEGSEDSWPRSPGTSTTASSPPIASPLSSFQARKTMTAADKFVKARRRASAELFSAVTLGRRSGEVESSYSNSSRPTTSSGASTRSSFYCKGDQMNNTMINQERQGIASTSISPMNASTPIASSPSLLSGLRRSASKRSTSSQSTRNSLRLSTSTLATMFPSTFLQANEPLNANSISTSRDGISNLDANSPSETSQSTAFSPSPRTPSMHMFEGGSSEGKEDDRERIGLGKCSNSSVLGLNLYHDGKDLFKQPQHHQVSALQQQRMPREQSRSSIFYPDMDYRPEPIIIESPSSEDLATLLNNVSISDYKCKEEEKGMGMDGSAVSHPRRPNMLITSPSLPLMHQVESKPISTQERHLLTQQQAIPGSPSRFSTTLGKLSGRRNLTNRLYSPKSTASVSPKKNQRQATLLHSSSQSVLPVKGSRLFGVGVGGGGGGVGKWGSEGDGTPEASWRETVFEINAGPTPPIVERILPPEEIIATIDRLRGQESHTSLRSTHSRDGEIDGIAGREKKRHQSRRPKTSLGLSASMKGGGGASLQSPVDQQQLQQHGDAIVADLTSNVTNKWENSQRLRSLPAPPRLNRKSRLNITNQRGGDSENKENEEAVKNSTSSMSISGKDSDVMLEKVALSMQQQPLRTSISESFSITMMGRAQWQIGSVQ